jgi:hypothetical protein
LKPAFIEPDVIMNEHGMRAHTIREEKKGEAGSKEDFMKLAAALAYISMLTILFCLSLKGVIAGVAPETPASAVVTTQTGIYETLYGLME